MKYDRFYHFRQLSNSKLIEPPRRIQPDHDGDIEAWLVHRVQYRTAKLGGGISVFAKVVDDNGKRVIQWTAAKCLKQDRFNRKAGAKACLENIEKGKSITLDDISFDSSFDFARKIADSVLSYNVELGLSKIKNSLEA